MSIIGELFTCSGGGGVGDGVVNNFPPLFSHKHTQQILFDIGDKMVSSTKIGHFLSILQSSL